VNSNEAEGFFPEREVLRARRQRAMAHGPVDPSEPRTRRPGLWMLWVAVFLPMLVSTISFGWNGHLTPRSAKVLVFGLWVVLAACAALVAVGIWKNLRRTNRASS
jgi:hypothetical protein